MLSMSPTTPGTQGGSNQQQQQQQQQQDLSFIASPTQVHHHHHQHHRQHSRSHSQSQSTASLKRPADSDDDDGDGDANDHNDHGHDRDGSSAQAQAARRTAVVKRACNECRQQKLRCTVKQDPFEPCERCTKQRLRCVIEPNFKRVGKRNRNAEMEREMELLRERLALYEGRGVLAHQTGPPPPSSSNNGSSSSSNNNNMINNINSAGPRHDDPYLHTQHQQVAATSLLDLRSGSPMFTSLGSGSNEVRLSPATISDLFLDFFQHYHPFLPFLDPTRSPDDVYSKDSRLLFWAIISVAARHYDADANLLNRLKEPLTDEIWRTIKTQPNHHVVKALCLLCTWPLPARTTVSDPTFMLCGVMMQIAMQIGLHQPTHPQDFSRTKVRLQEPDIHDRLRTWAVCNIVAQTVSTGNGQPSITLYDSTLEFRTDDEDHMRIIPPNLFVRLRQEMAASRINKLLYASTSRTFADTAAATYMSLENDRLKEERGLLDGVDKKLEELHHRAVSLHLHLYSFFNSEQRLERRDDLVALYYAATNFLESCFELQSEDRLKYVPYYIMQMALAAGFALLKLLNSDFAARLPFDQGRSFVLKTIDAMRKSKVMPNDLMDRFAEVLAQLWKESSRGRSLHSMSQSPIVGNPNVAMFSNHGQRRESNGMLEDPLGLIIRSRMSMSVVFDCVWRWRESQVGSASEQLDATVVNNPTNPDSSTNSTPPPGGIIENPAHSLPQFNPHLNTLSMPLQLPNGLASANSFEVFDPMTWMLESQNEWATTYGAGPFAHDFGA